MQNSLSGAGLLARPPLFPEPTGAVLKALHQVSGLKAASELYSRLPATSGVRFVDDSLDALGVRWTLDGEGLAAVPPSGPALVVANHPFGGVEGLVLLRLLLSVRSDVRILANHYLGRIPELSPFVIGVDVFEEPDKRAMNPRSLRSALRWLRAGGVLACFPAGEVSSFQPSERCVADPEWCPHVSRLAKLTEAPVVPVYFHGKNGVAFQIAGLVHPRLRTMLLPRELLNKKGKTVEVSAGPAMTPPAALAGGQPETLARYLKLQTYALAAGKASRGKARGATALETIAPSVPPKRLEAELRDLDPRQRLAAGGGLEVWMARAAEIPNVLEEIGVQREHAFRAAGEGTGRARDLDRHDQHYDHLFLWSPSRREIAGAYRMGRVREILQRQGARGLYTTSLFRFAPGFLEHVSDGLEMGRSFLREGYRGSHGPLFLLWKGIGRFVRENPRYRYLFGPVSISDLYCPFSKDLLVSHFSGGARDESLAKWVRPRRPYVPELKEVPPSLRAVARSLDLESVERLIQSTERGEGVPVLFRHYSRLGGRFLAFNVDPDFSNAVDGLVLVDLLETEPQLLSRYLGSDGAASFRSFHSSRRETVPDAATRGQSARWWDAVPRMVRAFAG